MPPSQCYNVSTSYYRCPFFLTNFCTVYAAVSSASLSLLATGIDSIFDVGSNFLLYYIHHKSSRMDVNKWPVGGARLETIGNVIYGMTHLLHFTNRIDLSSSGFLCECYSLLCVELVITCA